MFWRKLVKNINNLIVLRRWHFGLTRELTLVKSCLKFSGLSPQWEQKFPHDAYWKSLYLVGKKMIHLMKWLIRRSLIKKKKYISTKSDVSLYVEWKQRREANKKYAFNTSKQSEPFAKAEKILKDLIFISRNHLIKRLSVTCQRNRNEMKCNERK